MTAYQNLIFSGAFGSSVPWLEGGADTATSGAGGGQFYAGSNGRFSVVAGTGGSDTIFGCSGGDRIDLSGCFANPVAGASVAGGNASVTLTDGTSITFDGITQLPRFA